MSEALNKEKDATTHPNQTTQNNTETLLSKILANLSDARFTDDDSLNMMYHIFINENLTLNTCSNLCEKFNKEVPHITSRSTSNYSIKTLYEWLRDDNNHAFEELKFTYFDFPDDLDTASEYTLSAFYHYFFDDGGYVFSSRSATWYYYDDDNILKETTTKHPFKLKSEICKHLTSYFRQLRFKMKLPDKDAENYKEQSEHFCREISTIEKTIKLVGSGAFSDSVDVSTRFQ